MYSALVYSADAGPICRRALYEWGADGQVAVAVEEITELIRALARFHTPNRFSEENLIEEIADVLIVLEQMMVLYDCRERVGVVYNEIAETMDTDDEPVAVLRYKLERLLLEIDAYFLGWTEEKDLFSFMGEVSRSLEVLVDRYGMNAAVGNIVNEKLAKVSKKLDETSPV